jgi:hypothetical protein
MIAAIAELLILRREGLGGTPRAGIPLCAHEAFHVAGRGDVLSDRQPAFRGRGSSMTTRAMTKTVAVEARWRRTVRPQSAIFAKPPEANRLYDSL